MSTTIPQLTLDVNSLPIGQLESLKFKCHQLMESIQTLQQIVECCGQNYMPPWPDLLSKYNMLVSLSLNLSNALQIGRGEAGAVAGGCERISVHPSVEMSDAALDNELIPLLRNQQTTEVLRVENETVRTLAERMVTRGSLGLVGAARGNAKGGSV